MSSQVDFSPVYKALSESLKAAPESPEGAHVHAKLAEVLLAVARTERISEELAAMRKPKSSLPTTIDHFCTRLGGVVSLLGVGGSIALATQYFKVEGERKGMVEQLSAEKQAVANGKSELEKQGMEIQVQKEKAEVQTERANLRVERAEEEKGKAEKQMGEAQEKMGVAKTEESNAIARTKEERLRTDAQRAKFEELDKEMAKLAKLDRALASRVAEVLGKESAWSKSLEPVADVAPTQVVVNQFRPEVEKLFHQDPAIRGSTYSKLTSGKDRVNPALLEALLEVGEEKFTRLGNKDIPEQDAALLRRGLENVVVTLRDMSRSVTKIPEKNRARVLSFADKLVASGSGVGEEALSLKNWLNNGNNQ